MTTTPNVHTIFILSDGTGETAATMVRAALVQYAEQEINIIRSKNLRTEEQILRVIDDCFEKRGMVAYTFASPVIRKKIAEVCIEKSIPAIDLLGPLINTLDDFFGVASASQTGLLRQTNDHYYKRIEAIEYTVRNDDGKITNELDKADIVLVGISRTSKTPLSIFLSHKGWKVANIPLVLGTEVPKQLFEIDQRKIVGLIIDIDSLQRIRKNRLEKFGQDTGGDYASSQQILKEIEYAETLFKQNKRWPVFNVTERALEETASEIVRLIAARMGLPDSVLF
ncbi:pyruvate, water dikinase regulatory protein [Pseudobdellovibrio sp. HCB154]|uniref:pyruvate, water dikinase regulatory protein n=1 Tax=Pseudobdellovibrio sp. HCB154 TaxID=3386277 RepID=UPI003916D241